jgi:hypothetical protein
MLELPAELDVSSPLLVKGQRGSTTRWWTHPLTNTMITGLTFFSEANSPSSWERKNSDYSMEAEFSKEANSHLGLSAQPWVPSSSHTPN